MASPFLMLPLFSGGGPEPSYPAVLDVSAVRSLSQARANAESGAEQYVDARAAGRFLGRDPEPRPGLRSGHIPGSKNVFFGDVVDVAAGRLRSPAEVSAALTNAGVDLAMPVTVTCGSGLTACLVRVMVGPYSLADATRIIWRRIKALALTPAGGAGHPQRRAGEEGQPV